MTNHKLSHSRLAILMFSALWVQLIIHYFAKSPHFIVWNNFFVLTFVLRLFLLPAIAFLWLGFHPKELGLGCPLLSRKKFTIISIGLLVLPMLISVIRFNANYLEYYSYWSSGTNFDLRINKILKFMVFTASTLPGWEFLHRGFLLFGIKKYLTAIFSNGTKFSDHQHAYQIISLLIVCVFESLYHIQKPYLEAFGMTIASPILSLIAFRTHSLWLPFFIHLYLEGIFIWFITA